MISGLSRVLRFLPSVTAALLFLLFAAAPGTGAPLPPLRVVMDDSYPPYVFRESDNTLSGILVDQWKLWSEKTGRRVQVTGIPWGEALRRMEAGEFDVIDTIFRTSDRERRFDFTPPYARIEVPLFFHSDITGIQDAHDAKGFMVAVKRGDAAIDILREAGVGSLVEYPGYLEIVAAAKDGRVKVFTIDRPPALYFLNKAGIADRFRETKPLYTGEFHRAVRKGDAATLAAVSDGFGRISRAEFDRIDRRWSGSPLAGWLTPGRMRWAGGGFAVVALSMAAWLVTMRRIVEARTRQLHASETRYRLLVENQTDLVVQVDMEGRFQFVNEAYCRMFDKTREELLGRTFMPLVHEEDRDSTSRAMEGLDRHPYHVYLEQRAMTKEGWRWLAWVDTALRGRDGEMIAIHGIGRDITPRKEAEIALRESEGRFRNAIDFLPIPIGISSADGEILTINQEFTRRFGYTLEDIPTIDAWMALAYPDPAYRELMSSNWRRDIAGAEREGSATSVREYRIDCLDGETREVEIRTQPVGKQLVTAFNDITELRAHEREIVRLNRIYATRSQISQCVTRVRSAEELYLEACRVAASTGRFALAWIGLVDRGTGEVRVAAKAGKAAGYLVGIRVSADDRPEGAGPMGTCIREGRTYVCNDFANDPATHLWADRARRFGLRSAVAVPLRMGDAVYGAMMAYSEEASVFHEKEIALLEEATLDISFGLEFLEHDRKRGLAEERLRESRERVGLILDSAAEGIYGVDREGGCTFCNASALRMLGYPEEGALLGRNLHALIRHTDEQGEPCPAGDGADWRAIWMGEHAHLDRVLLWRSDGTSFLGEMWAYPLLGEGGNVGAVVTFVDISKRVALEDQLLQAQKMEAVGRLAGGVAHDFNNLLTAILGYGALATRKAAGNAELLRDLEQIRLAGDQAASLTRQLLAFSRKQILRPRVISLAGVVREIQAMIGRLLGEDIALVVDAPAGTGFIEADPGQVHQVIMNLVVNARDAMPEGGTVTLRTSDAVVPPGGAAEAAGIFPGAYTLLSVTDTGCGMDEATRLRLFEPFFTTKEPGRGTGLGLATVHGIVTQSGGYIRVRSEEGKGTTFRIYFPRVEAEIVATEAAAAPTVLPRGNEVILVAEDSEEVRELTCRTLAMQGYRVLEAANGAEAIAVARRCPQPIRLLLTDVVMPGMSGRTLADALTAEMPGLAVAYTSGYTEDAIVRHGVLEPGIRFLPKPFLPSELAIFVRDVIGPAEEPAGNETA